MKRQGFQSAWMRMGLTIAALLTLCACRGGGTETRTGGEAVPFSGVSATELQDQLFEFGSRFDATLRAAADRIYTRSEDRKVRRMTLTWRLRVIPTTHDIISQSDPRQSLLDLWGLCVVQQQYLESAAVEDVPEEFREIAMEAAQSLTRNIEELAAMVMPASSYERAKEAVYEFARSNALGGLTQTDWKRPSMVAESQPGAFQSILSMPFKALGGVDSAAVAIEDVAQAARKFTIVARSMPERVRWETELLLYDIEERETTVQVLRNMDSITAQLTKFVDEVGAFNVTAEELIATAKDLPGEMRAELKGALADVKEHQQDLRDTANTIEALSSKIEKSSAELAAAGNAWTGTTKAVDEFVKQFQTPPGVPQPPPDPNAKPFDIDDYGKAAARFTELAMQLQKTIADLNATASSGNLAHGISESVAAGEAGAQRVVNAAMWRLAGLIGLVFVLAVVYRVVFRKR